MFSYGFQENLAQFEKSFPVVVQSSVTRPGKNADGRTN